MAKITEKKIENHLVLNLPKSKKFVEVNKNNLIFLFNSHLRSSVQNLRLFG